MRKHGIEFDEKYMWDEASVQPSLRDMASGFLALRVFSSGPNF